MDGEHSHPDLNMVKSSRTLCLWICKWSRECLVCLLGCHRRHHHQPLNDTNKREWTWVLLLAVLFPVTAFLFYYWLIMLNYTDWINTFAYERLGRWFNFSFAMLFLTGILLCYTGFLLVLTVFHVTCDNRIYFYWLHKMLIVLVFLSSIIMAVVGHWPVGWNLESLSLHIFAPFLHVVFVISLTPLSWILAGYWACIKNTQKKMLVLYVSILPIGFVYIIPVFVNSPCICEDKYLPEKPKLFAHKGASALAPENTLVSFKLALNYSAYGLESDVSISLDGEPFLLHDSSLQRTTNVDAEFPTRTKDDASLFTVSDLKKLDAGSWTANRHDLSHRASLLRAQPRPQTIPLLKEMLQLIEPTDAHLMLDVRQPPSNHPYVRNYTTIVINTLIKSGFRQDRVHWLGNLPANLTMQPNFLMIREAKFDRNVNTIREQGYSQINARTDHLSLENIKFIQSQNIKVQMYIVDTSWLLSLYWCVGTFAVTTDYIHTLSNLERPVWHMTPVQYRSLWICVDIMSFLIVVTFFVIHKKRSRHKVIRRP